MRLFARKLAEAAKPELFDFYFAGLPLEDGGEIGRYVRNDRGMIGEIPGVRASLRLIIFEPSLTDVYAGGPDLLAVVDDLLSTVEVVCQYGGNFLNRERTIKDLCGRHCPVTGDE